MAWKPLNEGMLLGGADSPLRFTLGRRLGRGGMGEVYLATENLTGVEYALKTLQDEKEDEAHVTEHFTCEATLWTHLSVHPNIVTAHGFLVFPELGHRPFIQMALVKGPSLRAVLRAEKALAPAQATAYALAVCYGLRDVYDRKRTRDCLIHRDVSPENILVESVNNRAMLTDFGLARFERENTVGRFGGKFLYMAPEVLKRAGWDGIAQSQGLDQRADIYSLGAVLYEMLCGETPHARYHKLFDGILNHMPEPLSARLSAGGRDAPRRLLDTVLACLAKDPAGRPQSWALLARELEECEREALREKGLSACAGCGFAALPGRTPSPCPVCEGNDWRGLRTVIRRPPELPPPPPPTGTASRKEEAGTEELRPRPSPLDAEAAQVADKLGFILIPGGRAPAGCNRTRFTDLVNSGFGSAVRSLETPAARNVNLPAFEIAQIPVTAEAYRAFERATGYVRTAKGYVPSGDPNLPVVHVAVPDAEAFCDWLGCRLPTPEEWEKAARGFDGRAYPWGNEFTARKCTCREGGATGPTPVFAHPDGKSPFGVWDCVGNVAELADGGERGGRYALGGSYEDQCELYGLLWGRITRIAPDEGYAWVGFRTVRDPLVRVDLPPWKERFVRVEGTVAVGCDRSLIPLLECRMPLAEELLESLCANPLRMLNVPAFDMARFPVTNEDYWEFTQATHRASPASWARQPFPWNRRPFLNQRKFHPVTHVSQADAQAFCRWLGDRDGHRYRLPTGVEWEAAARGSDDRAYPWGDAFDPAACNGGGSAWQRTVDVREYPTGDSPWGCRQMAGNVFEWLSEHDSRWWHMRGGSYQSLGEAYGLVFLDLRTNVEADEGTGFRIVREVSNR